MKYFVCALLALSFALSSESAGAQTKLSSKSGTHKKKSHTSTKPQLSHPIAAASPKAADRPTYNLDSGSVGNYFFPANLGAKWTMRIVTQIFDNQSKLVRVDTSYSFERVVNDSNRTIQGAPVIEVESSRPYKWGDELTAATMPVTYYVDDSIAMFVINHSLTSTDNRFLLVNPLKVGNHWHDKQEDTVVSEIIALSEPVTVPYGQFANALVVRTKTHDGDLAKFFVPGVGIAKMVYRGWPERLNGVVVVTTELIALDKGDPTHSIKARFAQQNLY
jgi:hypothetical protein